MPVGGSWTYDPELKTAKDRLRFEIGDVFEARQLLTDEEINYLLDVYGNTGDGFLDAAGHAAEKIANRIAGDPDFQRGSWRADRSVVVQNYLIMADAFRQRRGKGPVFVTTDTPRRPYVSIGMHDFPDTPSTMARDEEPTYRP